MYRADFDEKRASRVYKMHISVISASNRPINIVVLSRGGLAHI